MQELIDAIGAKNFGKARKLVLSRGADVNYIGTFDNTPLLVAIETDDVPMVEFLIEHGADVNQQDRNGWTPLMSLFAGIIDEMGQDGLDKPREEAMKVLGCLVEQGADIDLVNKDGESLVDLFEIRGGPISSYNALVEQFEALIPGLYGRMTYRKEEMEDFRYYGKGQPLPATELTDVQDQQIDKLHKAIYTGNGKLVQSMMDDGIDIHRKSHRGRYAADIAITAINYDIMVVLIYNGLDLNHQYNGTTALHQTLRASIKANLRHSGYEPGNTLLKMIKLLLDNGAQMGISDAEGIRPIDLFKLFGSPGEYGYGSIETYNEVIGHYGKSINGLLNMLEHRREELMEYRAKIGKGK